MKFLLAAATLLGVSSAQLSHDYSYDLTVSPISEYEEPKPEPVIIQQKSISPVIQNKEEVKQVQQNKVIQVVQPVEQPARQPTTPTDMPAETLVDKEDLRPDHFHDTDFSGPMPGREQFNPTIPEIQQVVNDKDDGHKNKQKKKHHKKQKNTKENADSREWQNQYNSYGKQQGKHHKQMWGPFVAVAIVFTIIGILLGKCIIKMKKCRKHCQQRREALKRTSVVVQDEIRSQEERVNELKVLYNQKLLQQNNINQMNRPQRLQMQTHEERMIQMIQPQQYQNVQYMRGTPVLRAYPN